MRSAAFFGIKSIIIPADEAQTTVTTSTYRVAKGGMEFVSVYTVKNPDFFLKDISSRITKIGTSIKKAAPVSDLHKFSTSKGDELKKPVLVILGNEEDGISESVLKECDSLVTIPTARKKIDSLNVAQAASIIFYELMRP